MKKFYIVFIAVLCIFSSFAQDVKKKDMKKQIEAQKVSFFTQELDLSPKEAQTFWPLYNEMNKKLWALKTTRRTLCCKKINIESMSEKDASERCDKIMKVEKDIFSIRNGYFLKIKKVLGAKKMYKFFSVERSFNRRLLNKLGGRHKRSSNRRLQE